MNANYAIALTISALISVVVLIVVCLRRDINERKVREEELQNSENKLRSLISAMTDVIIVLDGDGRYIEIAPTNADLLYLPPQELIGKTLHDVLPVEFADTYLKVIQDVLKAGKVIPIDYQLSIQGNMIWFSGNVSRLSENRVLWVARDITERKKVEEEVQKFKLGIERSNDAIFMCDRQGIITYANDAFEKVYGYNLEETLGQTPRILKSGLIPQEQYQMFWGALLNKGSIDGEIINKAKDGRYLQIDGSNNPILSSEGEIIGFLSVHRDITERKIAEEELRKSETKFRALFSAMLDVIVVFDIDGRYLEIAPTSTSGLYLSPPEILGKTVSELLPADTAAAILQAVRQSVTTQTLTKVDYSLPIENELLWFSAAISPLTKDTVIFVAHDITDQKKSSQVLEEKDIQYQELVNSLSEGIVIVDLEEYFVFSNPTSDKFFGVFPDSLVGRNIQEFVDKDIFEFLKLQTLERIAGKSGRYDLNITRLDGAHRILQVSPRPQYDQTGNIIGTFAVFRDITEQKQAELALQQSENKLRSLFTAMSDIIIIYDINGRYVEIAPTNTNMLFRPPEELINRTIAEVFEPDITKTFMDTIQTALKTGEMIRFDYNMTIGNANYWFSANVSPMSEDRVIWVARDITERKKVEETLQYNNNHDILTGLYNRQYYEAEIIRLQNSRQFPISIIMMDVDGLKWVNDNLGHTAGDELLQRVAGVLKSTFRPEDLVARMGGDEFVVILPGTTSVIAGQAVQRLISVLNVHNSLFPSDQQLRLSIGKATGEEKTVLTEVFKQADEVMYLDKANKKK